MFLTKDSKSPYYQLVYFVNGKRTKISTKTSDREEAEKFKATFKPKPITEPTAVNVSIKLSRLKISNITPAIIAAISLTIPSIITWTLNLILLSKDWYNNFKDGTSIELFRETENNLPKEINKKNNIKVDTSIEYPKKVPTKIAKTTKIPSKNAGNNKVTFKP